MNIAEAIKHYSDKSSFHVYYLVKGSIVVYVGSSRQVSTRLSTHRVGCMDFDSVRVEQCASFPKMFELESESIVKLNPKYNKSLPTNKNHKNITDCKKSASDLVASHINDLPRSFSRIKCGYISKAIHDEFMSSLEDFAAKKVGEIVKNTLLENGE